jgi:hypothetical protein
MKRSKNKLSNLLKNSYIAYYWLGFLMADGHFSRKESIKLSINKKDLKHLEKFALFVNGYISSERENSVYTVNLMDKRVVKFLKKKFTISHIKTYIPPKIRIFKKMTDNQFLSFFVGYVDGDGSIIYDKSKNRFFMSLCCYFTWTKIYCYFLKRLTKILNCQIKSKVSVRNRKTNFSEFTKYTSLQINKIDFLQKLKNHTIRLKLPILKRKWDLIDLTKISRQKTIEKNIEKIGQLAKDGHTKLSIAAQLEIHPSSLTDLIRKKKIKHPNLMPNISHRSKKINQFDLSDKLIKTWSSITCAAKFNKITLKNISCCLNERSKTAGGYKWKYYV